VNIPTAILTGVHAALVQAERAASQAVTEACERGDIVATTKARMLWADVMNARVDFAVYVIADMPADRLTVALS
jgi:hypothetical protein